MVFATHLRSAHDVYVEGSALGFCVWVQTYTSNINRGKCCHSHNSIVCFWSIPSCSSSLSPTIIFRMSNVSTSFTIEGPILPHTVYCDWVGFFLILESWFIAIQNMSRHLEAASEVGERLLKTNKCERKKSHFCIFRKNIFRKYFSKIELWKTSCKSFFATTFALLNIFC